MWIFIFFISVFNFNGKKICEFKLSKRGSHQREARMEICTLKFLNLYEKNFFPFFNTHRYYFRSLVIHLFKSDR